MIAIEYRIATKDRAEFLHLLDALAAERRRDGAYAWNVFEDVEAPGRLVETFLAESWMEHLRQHERVTEADRALQEQLQRFLLQPPRVKHLVTAEAASG